MNCVHFALHDYSRVVAAITDADSIKRYLDGVGLSSELPVLNPARPPSQIEFEYEDLDYDEGA
jgi:hypothetical protein